MIYMDFIVFDLRENIGCINILLLFIFIIILLYLNFSDYCDCVTESSSIYWVYIKLYINTVLSKNIHVITIKLKML